MAKLDELLRLMKQQNASDLHLSSGSAPYLRIHGEMVKLNYREVSHETCQSLIFQILTEKQRELFAENWELDLSYPLPEVGRFRVNVFMQRNGVAAVFRLIPEKVQTVEELGCFRRSSPRHRANRLRQKHHAGRAHSLHQHERAGAHHHD